MGIFSRSKRREFWLESPIQGDPEFLRHYAVQQLVGEHYRNVIACGCEIWRIAGLASNQASNLIYDGYRGWRDSAEFCSDDGIAFLRYVMGRIGDPPRPPTGPLRLIPPEIVQPISVVQATLGWVGTNLVELVATPEGAGPAPGVEEEVFRVLSQLHPDLAPPLAQDFVTNYANSHGLRTPFQR
jgi:hypothetical protein